MASHLRGAGFGISQRYPFGRWLGECIIAWYGPARFITEPLGDRMPVLNIPLLKETLAYVEAHPEEHDQSEWRCGTTLCFAGHAAVLAGGRWRVASGPVYERSPLRGMDYMEPEPEDPEEDIIVSRVDLLGEVIHVADRARRVLGLTREEAEDLFMNPDLTSLKYNIKQLVQDEIVGSR